MTWRAAMAEAWLATIRHGRWWAVALAAFLVRGGILVLLPAIITLPTPAQLALVILDPAITGAGLASPGPALVGLLAALVLGGAALIVATGLVGVWLDGQLFVAVVAHAALGPPGGAAGQPPRRAARAPLVRGLVVRLAAHVPTLVAAGAAIVALAQATYAELLSPSGSDLLVVRVVARAPLATAVLVGCWLLGETWGGIALRRLGRGDSIGRALLEGLARLGRPSGLAILAVTTLAVVVPLAAAWLLAGGAFARLWPLVVDRADPLLVAAALGLLVAAWIAGLWWLAIALAWRSVTWTLEVLRAS
jgi:hypothetical protein